MNCLALFWAGSQQRGGILDPRYFAEAQECEYSALGPCRLQIIPELRGIVISDCRTRIDIRLPINRHLNATLPDRERIRTARYEISFPEDQIATSGKRKGRISAISGRARARNAHLAISVGSGRASFWSVSTSNWASNSSARETASSLLGLQLACQELLHQLVKDNPAQRSTADHFHLFDKRIGHHHRVDRINEAVLIVIARTTPDNRRCALGLPFLALSRRYRRFASSRSAVACRASDAGKARNIQFREFPLPEID